MKNARGFVLVCLLVATGFVLGYGYADLNCSLDVLNGQLDQLEQSLQNVGDLVR